MTKALAKLNEEEIFNLRQRQAKVLESSDIAPTHFRGNMANCIIAVNMAERIGADPLMVAQSLYVVHGKPAFSSSFLIATVNKSGRFTPIRYRMEGEPGKDNWGCRAYATDKEDGEECLGPLVTMAMAKAEKWSTKNGSKWQTMPELMLRYRAAAFWVRTFAPELSLGMHTAEEVRDMQETIEPAAIVAREGETSLDAFTRTMEEQEGETTEREPGADEHLDADFEDGDQIEK